jgi:drug/metabolite transporter (DMT)-like permease
MNRKVLENSIDTLKILYMVVAGLALACGLERLVFSNNGQFQLPTDITVIAFFIIFVTTVVRFVHGAMRHFHHYYLEQPQQTRWRKRQPLWDFAALGGEAFLFFLLAFSASDPLRFITYYLILLLIDSIWLIGIPFPHIERVWTGTPRNWIIANLTVLVPTGIPWFWFHNTQIAPPWLLGVFFAGVLAHTVMDYRLNWQFYFGQPWSG